MSAYFRRPVVCSRKDCFAYREGCCIVLLDTDFGRRSCPFYKTEEEFRRGQQPRKRPEPLPEGYEDDETGDEE